MDRQTELSETACVLVLQDSKALIVKLHALGQHAQLLVS